MADYEIIVRPEGCNPLINISKERMTKFFREIADEAGFENHELVAVQTKLSTAEFMMGIPEVMLMVSNVTRDQFKTEVEFDRYQEGKEE